MIQNKRDHHIMNSRSKFNRCAIARLVTKVGDKELKKWRYKDKEMQDTEEKIEEQIRLLKKEREQVIKGESQTLRHRN